jgi:hypothetical protein
MTALVAVSQAGIISTIAPATEAGAFARWLPAARIASLHPSG